MDERQLVSQMGRRTERRWEGSGRVKEERGQAVEAQEDRAREGRSQPDQQGKGPGKRRGPPWPVKCLWASGQMFPVESSQPGLEIIIWIASDF